MELSNSGKHVINGYNHCGTNLNYFRYRTLMRYLPHQKEDSLLCHHRQSSSLWGLYEAAGQWLEEAKVPVTSE